MSSGFKTFNKEVRYLTLMFYHYLCMYIIIFRFVANLTDFGEYTCLAENLYGNASYTYLLYIWGKMKTQFCIYYNSFGICLFCVSTY